MGLILWAKGVRSFAFGWLSVILALYLAERGLGAMEIGAVFTATMVEDAVLTVLLSAVAARWGPARVMAAAAPLMVLGGAALAGAEVRWLLLVAAVVGTISPNGQEAGPFSPLEQALLPAAAAPGRPPARSAGTTCAASCPPRRAPWPRDGGSAGACRTALPPSRPIGACCGCTRLPVRS
jgi:MFS family permease